MRFLQFLEDLTMSFPEKVTLSDVKHSLEHEHENFEKNTSFRVDMLSAEKISKLPAKSMIEIPGAEDEEISFYYHSGSAWFDSTGKKVEPQKMVKYLRDTGTTQVDIWQLAA